VKGVRAAKVLEVQPSRVVLSTCIEQQMLWRVMQAAAGGRASLLLPS
jgi:hypothetical protein